MLLSHGASPLNASAPQLGTFMTPEEAISANMGRGADAEDGQAASVAARLVPYTPGGARVRVLHHAVEVKPWRQRACQAARQLGGA